MSSTEARRGPAVMSKRPHRSRPTRGKEASRPGRSSNATTAQRVACASDSVGAWRMACARCSRRVWTLGLGFGGRMGPRSLGSRPDAVPKRKIRDGRGDERHAHAQDPGAQRTLASDRRGCSHPLPAASRGCGSALTEARKPRTGTSDRAWPRARGQPSRKTSSSEVAVRTRSAYRASSESAAE